MQFSTKEEHKLRRVGQLAAPKKSYSQPASFCEINTFSYDFCIPADSWPGSPANHHTRHTAASFTITNTKYCMPWQC